jgi:hypothetical protein
LRQVNALFTVLLSEALTKQTSILDSERRWAELQSNPKPLGYLADQASRQPIVKLEEREKLARRAAPAAEASLDFTG